jgi:hypothetical protein
MLRAASKVYDNAQARAGLGETRIGRMEAPLTECSADVRVDRETPGVTAEARSTPRGGTAPDRIEGVGSGGPP